MIINKLSISSDKSQTVSIYSDLRQWTLSPDAYTHKKKQVHPLL